MSIIPLLLLLLNCFLFANSEIDRQHSDMNTRKDVPKKNYPPLVEVEDKIFWNNSAQAELKLTLEAKTNTNVAKNVILFLGDGMGNPTIVAARIYKGQKISGIAGEEETLVFENFDNVALSKTYCVNKQVADSACTGTAYLTGVKTNYKLIGVDSTVEQGKCETITEDNKVYSIAKWALDKGKRAGIVTSTRITHATPAATYAHVAHRDWECDAEIKEEVEKCPELKDIARQLVEDEPGKLFNVIMGGGYQGMVANATDREGDPIDYEECIREDGRDLFQEWQDDREDEGKSYEAVRTRSELMDLDLNGVEHLMGIYGNSHTAWEHEKREQNLDIPTLSEMTKRALEVLQQGEKGYFLLVEGGRIDHAHHDGTARKALDETVAFDKAIQTALDMIDLEETLVVVTADHSHTMTINGYPERGDDILGLAGDGADDLPYTTLMYTNGNGFNYTTNNESEGVRWDITGENTTGWDYLQLTAVPRDSETHGGEDVAIYAMGPMSHLFNGVRQQNYIAHAMGYAACIGPNEDHCSGSAAVYASLGLIVVALIAQILPNNNNL